MAFDLIGRVDAPRDCVLSDRRHKRLRVLRVVDRSLVAGMSAGFHLRNTPADVICDAFLVLRLARSHRASAMACS